MKQMDDLMRLRAASETYEPGRRLTVMKYVLGICLALSSALLAAPPSEVPVAKNRFNRPSQRTGVPQQQQHVRQAGDSANAVAVNAASYLPGVSPGGLSTIFGQNLSDVSGIVQATTEPLPYVLADVEVDVNGIRAPLFTVAYNGQEDQINFQVPYGAPTGPSAVDIQVYNHGRLVADFITDSYTEDPGIFTYGSNNYAVAFLGLDGSLIGPTNPAFPGDILVLYTTGLGPLSVNLPDGYGAPTNPLAYTVDPFQVLVDGSNCSVLFSGLAPGFVALYQINFRLPSNLPAGNLSLQITSPYASSGTVILPVR